MLTRFFIILSLTLHFSCKKSSEVTQKMLTGINGTAVYLINPDGSIGGVFKPEYNVHDFAIILKKDTIKVGEEFASSIYVTNPKHKVVIFKPSQEVMAGSGKEDNHSKAYLYKAEKPGIYDFQGTIEYDSSIIPFQYKFVVVNND